MPPPRFLLFHLGPPQPAPDPSTARFAIGTSRRSWKRKGEGRKFCVYSEVSMLPPPLANLLDSSPPSFRFFLFPHILLFFPPLSAATSHRASIHVQVIPCTSNSKKMFNFYFRLRNVSMIFKEGNGMLISCMAGRIFSHIFYYSVK